MDDYMQTLHQRFFREPECTDVRDEIEELRRGLREKLKVLIAAMKAEETQAERKQLREAENRL